MKCKLCGNDRFIAHQIIHADIICDEDGLYEDDLGKNGNVAVYDRHEPYGPFTCTICGAEYEELKEDEEPRNRDKITLETLKEKTAYELLNIFRSPSEGLIRIAKATICEMADVAHAHEHIVSANFMREIGHDLGMHLSYDLYKGDAKEYVSLLLPNFTWNPPEPFWSNEYYFQWYRINDAGDLAAIQVAFFEPDCLAYCEEFEGPKWIQVAKTNDGYGEILDLDRIKERFDTYLNYATERTTHVDRKRADLVKRFKDASDEGMDETDFFLELIGNGVKLKDIWQCAPEYYEYSKKFMEDHGLI